MNGLLQVCCSCLWQALNCLTFGTLEQVVKLPLPHQNDGTEGTPVLCPHQINGKWHSEQETDIGREESWEETEEWVTGMAEPRWDEGDAARENGAG